MSHSKVSSSYGHMKSFSSDWINDNGRFSRGGEIFDRQFEIYFHQVLKKKKKLKDSHDLVKSSD